jgi:hypothetical protein
MHTCRRMAYPAERDIVIKNLIFKIIDLLLYSFCLDAKRTKKSRKINAIHPKGLSTPADFSDLRSGVPDVDCCNTFSLLPTSLPVRISNPYTNSSVLIKISIFSTHPLGPGKKCGKLALKTAKRVYIFVAGWHIRLSGREV